MTDSTTPETLAARALTDQARPAEHSAPDAETFDLGDWLTGGTEHRLREVVTVYRDAHLAADVERIEAAMKRAEEAPEGMESMGDAGAGELEREKQRLLERMEAAKAEVELYALIEPELAEIRAELGEKPKDYNYHQDMDYWYRILARAARLQGRALEPEQWAALHRTIGAQFAAIILRYQAAQQIDVTPRFRRGRPGERP
ncbi:hypothetical protein NBM05_08440 [Rothia sp. AR01]|uniref:Uncharacterized protein n=1 Tax=Rothia santali TaxID=2949643 RepID=A0A9X2HAH0_9MICC|nr:hypothetical protein [Rothia santali]MCP3426029.1 hypothetical protein [Rothia santali]